VGGTFGHKNYLFRGTAPPKYHKPFLILAKEQSEATLARELKHCSLAVCFSAKSPDAKMI